MAADETLETLYGQMTASWRQQDDVTRPCTDERRDVAPTVWTFDLDYDILRFDSPDEPCQVSLELLRLRPTTLADFQPFTPPSYQQIVKLYRHIDRLQCWPMHRTTVGAETMVRQKALIGRLLADFAFQWRHVLSTPYNHFTLRRMAAGIIRLATLDFTVQRAVDKRPGVGRDPIVSLDILPGWEPFEGDVQRVGAVSVVLSQHMIHARDLAQKDYGQSFDRYWRREGYWNVPFCRTYLLFSVRQVMLFRIRRGPDDSRAEPERLFDGTLPPSEAAVDLLIEAFQDPVSPQGARRLPLEVQDVVVENTSADPIERARMGCKHHLGSPFLWHSDGHALQRQEYYPNSPRNALADGSEIKFGNVPSGLVYA